MGGRIEISAQEKVTYQSGWDFNLSMGGKEVGCHIETRHPGLLCTYLLLEGGGSSVSSSRKRLILEITDANNNKFRITQHSAMHVYYIPSSISSPT